MAPPSREPQPTLPSRGKNPFADRSRARATVWRFTRTRPYLYRAIVTMKNGHGGRSFVTRDTALVIDGFERSGNTYAFFAFREANGPDLRIGHHTHSTAQFFWAERFGVPTILLVRDPADCAISAHVRWPVRELHEVLEDWIRFHETVLAWRYAFVVGGFDEVTKDFGSVIERVNGYFGTVFVPFDSSESAQQRVFDGIEKRNRGLHGRIVESVVARPSEERKQDADRLRADFDLPRSRRLLDEAMTLQAELVRGITRQ